jgi:hypothetical protein
MKTDVDDGLVSTRRRFNPTAWRIFGTLLPAVASALCDGREMLIALRCRSLARNGRRSVSDDDCRAGMTFSDVVRVNSTVIISWASASTPRCSFRHRRREGTPASHRANNLLFEVANHGYGELTLRGSTTMKIAQIAPLIESVPPRLYGGTERIVSYLTEELVHLGHEVTLFASGDSLTSANLISDVRQPYQRV